MPFIKLVRNVLGLLITLAVGAAVMPAHAQKCRDPWINQAYTAVMLRPAQGNGDSGECNKNLYGGGSWSSLQDLEVKVVHSKDCGDPWVGQLVFKYAHRQATADECTVSHYGGGHWSGYGDLDAKVQAYIATESAPRPTPPLVTAPRPGTGTSGFVVPEAGAITRARQAQLTQYHVDMSGNLIGPAGVFMARAGTYLINATIVAQGGGNIVAQGGGNIVAQGGGNVVPQPGMLVNTNGSNFIVPRK